MAGNTDYTAQHQLDWLTGKAAMPATTARYIALFTAVGSDAGTGFTEVSGNGYARAVTAAGDWNSASGSAPSSTSNANVISFPAATGAGWGTIIAFGLYDAASSGNLVAWDYLGAFDWREFSCTSASPGVLTAPAHGYVNADQVVVDAEFGAESLPATGGSWAGLLTVAGVTTDTFTAGVNTTGTGGGMVRKVVSQAVAAGAVFQFPAGQLSFVGT